MVLFGLIHQLPLLRVEFRIPKLTFHSDLRRRAASRLALPCPSSLLFVIPVVLKQKSHYLTLYKYNDEIAQTHNYSQEQLILCSIGLMCNGITNLVHVIIVKSNKSLRMRQIKRRYKGIKYVKRLKRSKAHIGLG